MNVLVIGGTGAVGGEVIKRLRDRGVKLRCMSRFANKLKSLPAGVEPCVGYLEKPGSLSMAFDGVIKKTLSTPSKAIDREPGFSRSPTQGSTPAGRDLSLLAKRLMQRNLTPRSRRLFMTSPPTAPVPPITNTFITTSTITQRSHRANRGSG